MIALFLLSFEVSRFNVPVGKCLTMRYGWQLEMEIPKTLWLKKHMKEEDFEKSFFFE